MEKIEYPPEDRKIDKNDFRNLIDQINSILEKDLLTEERVSKVNEKLEAFDLKHSNFENKLDQFYAKQIELFGIFIAIFSFIISGIQIATKVEGTIADKIASSCAIFFPVTICICIFFVLIRFVIKR